METKNEIQKNTVKVADNVNDLVLSLSNDNESVQKQIESIADLVEEFVEIFQKKV